MNENFRLKESSSIAAAAYDRRRRALQITFKPGRAEHRSGIYEYLGVPEKVVAQFLKADSLGRFVNWQIKPRFPYRKMRTAITARRRARAPIARPGTP